MADYTLKLPQMDGSGVIKVSESRQPQQMGEPVEEKMGEL